MKLPLKITVKREDLSLMLISLFLAAIIWGFVAVQPQQEVAGIPEWSINVPVEVRDLGGNLVLPQGARTVEVRLVAPQAQRDEIKRSLRAYILLGGLGEGKHIVKVHVTPPPTGRIIGIEPDYLELNLEAVTSRKEQVTVSLMGLPALEFALGHPQVAEGEVVLKGSPTLLNTVAQVVAQVDVGEVAQDVQTVAQVRVLGADGNPVPGVVAEPAEVHVQVPVIRIWKAHAARVRVVTTGEVPQGYQVKSITVEPVMTDVLIPPEALDPGEIKTQPVDLQDKKESFTAVVGLESPERGTTRYPTVQVRVEIVPLEA